MGYWIKYHSNETDIRGEDEDVGRGLVSWSRTCCQLIGAELNRGHRLIIRGDGEYWQSDTYESSLSMTDPILVKTRIEKKIGPKDLIYSMLARPQQTTIVFRMPTSTTPGWITRPVPEGMVGRWIILEYDLTTKLVRTYFTGEKI